MSKTLARHACGLCDGRLRFDGFEGGYPTWICAECGWWHIAKDCCEVQREPDPRIDMSDPVQAAAQRRYWDTPVPGSRVDEHDAARFSPEV